MSMSRLDINFPEAEAFLNALAPEGAFTFQTFPDGSNPTTTQKKALTRQFHGSFVEYCDELARLNEQGAGVYVTVNETDLKGRKAENITSVRALFVDLDGAPLEPVENFELPPSIINNTSEGKWHAHWLVDSLDLSEFTPLQETIAAKFDGDPLPKDLPRVMRLPGFYHQKGKSQKSELMFAHSDRRYTAEQIIEAFPPQSTPEPTPPSEVSTSGSSKAKELGLQAASKSHGSPDKPRHSIALGLGYDCIRAGLPREEAKIAAIEFADNARETTPSGDPAPFDQQEAIEAVLNAYADGKEVSPSDALVQHVVNRAKGNRTPFVAFGNSPAISGFNFDWSGILSRADALPPNKAWRFAPDAMEKWESTRDFLDRQLTDTAYLARVARFYLENICKDVSVTPGRLTAMLRGKWGLNSLLSDHNLKNRVDHRHHAVDAFVIGLTDRAMLQRIAGSADDTRARLIEKMPEPWQGFRSEVAEHLKRIVVSHRADHGVQGRLHVDTAYGFVSDPQAEDGYNLVYRKPFADLNENELARIRDRDLRASAQEQIAQAKAEKGGELTTAELKQALQDLNTQREANGLPPVRRVRLLKKEEQVVAITDRVGQTYKAYAAGANHHIDIYELSNGSWVGEAVTVFDAN